MGTQVDIIKARREAYRKDSSSDLITLISISELMLGEVKYELSKGGRSNTHKALKLGYEVQIKLATEVLAERGIKVK